MATRTPLDYHLQSSLPTFWFQMDDRRKALQKTAHETKKLLPQLLKLRRDAPPNGHYLEWRNLRGLDPMLRSSGLSTNIQVINGDTLDVALDIAASSKPRNSITANIPICVLNMANAKHGGGGWLSGKMAQEEELCYRSSLSFTLKIRHYPMDDLAAIYSPAVLVFRESFANGHKLYDLQKPELIPTVSVISMAALERPQVDDTVQPPKFKRIADRIITKEKMRLVLRTAAKHGHQKLVLGALGCGAFENPKEAVADCWAEVLQEAEFLGWWEDIVFAVLENTEEGTDPNGNFEVFRRRLHGLKV